MKIKLGHILETCNFETIKHYYKSIDSKTNEQLNFLMHFSFYYIIRMLNNVQKSRSLFQKFKNFVLKNKSLKIQKIFEKFFVDIICNILKKFKYT